MTWLLLLTLAAVVFFNRYVFLEPGVPLKIPRILSEALEYSAPCLLTAICGPIIFLEHGVLRSVAGNPYLLGSIISVVMAIYVRNMVLSVICSLILFYVLCYIL
ncbi:AzlD domain-containing protein [Pseudomonas sp. NPDC087614]|uniref:AzlD domain-containing protein n=1 Tax=Pseudomonas sp. NPDC087614 TaxID=3364442 RepID=UPI003800EF75